MSLLMNCLHIPVAVGLSSDSNQRTAMPQSGG
jgi:hypothetical protein